MLKISLKIEDEDGCEYSVKEVLQLFKAVEVIQNDERKVEKQQQAELFPCYSVQAMPIKGGGEWNLDQPTYARWESDFVGVNCKAELDKARAWLLANPNRLKTAKGMPAFCRNWLRRAYQATVDAVKMERQCKPEPKVTATPLNGSQARFALVKQGCQDARDWTDDECINQAKARNLC